MLTLIIPNIIIIVIIMISILCCLLNRTSQKRNDHNITHGKIKIKTISDGENCLYFRRRSENNINVPDAINTIKVKVFGHSAFMENLVFIILGRNQGEDRRYMVRFLRVEAATGLPVGIAWPRAGGQLSGGSPLPVPKLLFEPQPGRWPRAVRPHGPQE